MRITICLLLLANLAFAQKNDIRLKGMDAEIDHILKAYNAVGMSVAVVENNKVIHMQGFGYRDAEHQLPVTPNTIFPIGSITKSFTASLLGMLEGQGQLSLKDKPSQYIPALKFYSNEMDNHIAIDNLLSHTTGIGNADGSYILFPAESRLALMPRLQYLQPDGTPKDRWIYSNMGYIIAGTIAEQVSKQSWEQNIEQKIFTPLGMSSSGTSIAAMSKSADYAFGYGMSNGKVEKVLFEEQENARPAGAITSTASDMVKRLNIWLNNGSIDGKTILPEAYVQEAISFKAIDNGHPPDASEPGVYLFGYGYGWRVNSYKGHYKVQHGGNVSGFSSQVVMYPTDKLGVVVLTNQTNSILPYVITDLVASRMLKLPRTEWNKYPVKVSDINVVSKEIKGIDTEKKPTHVLADYSGKYANPGYGTFEIVNEANALYAVFPKHKLRLEHQHYDVFVLKATEEIPQNMNPEFCMNFSVNDDGDVAGVSINLQQEPVKFLKQEKE
ncbi:MAG: serine hydrolase [Sphingobacteriales bacterium]|nr:MAG: serine hydrolase [Sphingobacteriales bacterium]